MKTGAAGGIETVVKVINTHISNADVCDEGCYALGNLTGDNCKSNDNHNKTDKIETAENQVKAGTAGGIEAVAKAINTHINNSGVCEQGCGALYNMTAESASLQKEACEKGVLEVLLKILKEHSNNLDVSRECCGVVRALLSSPETHSMYCTPEVIRAIEECYEKHKDSEQIKQPFLSLKREEDPRVREAVARGVCTKEAFPKCSESCECDEGYYCPKCCVQQKAFRCLTCDKDKARFYCEVCWKRGHQGHKGEELFYPVRCATNHKS